MTDIASPGVASPDSGQPGWPARTALLVVVGAITAWLVWWIMDLDAPNYPVPADAAVLARRTAQAVGISVAALTFGFGLERVRIRWTIGFALALGLIAGLIVWWNGQPGSVRNWNDASLFLAIAIALPLFQVSRDEGRWSFAYAPIFGHALTNVILWCACWAFAGIAMLLTFLMSELFRLIGIDLIHDLLQKHGWFPALIIGGAYGAALGMLRDLDPVVRLLQRVVTTVLGVLAPVLAFGLVVFLLSLPFTGLHKLWEATRSTTPILLTCVIGALILINAVVGQGPSSEARNPVLRWAAMALGLTILPLAIVASIATGLRINQYGYTPDRLWALVAVVLATAYGLVYLVALARRRRDWALSVRPDNIRLAFATMLLALLLATPLIGFNTISVNSQIARLKSGKVPIDTFDWAALAFDFGEPGRAALKTLSMSKNAAIAAKATVALDTKDRWRLKPADPAETDDTPTTFDVRPAGATLPDALKQVIAADYSACGGSAYCRVYLQPDGVSAAVIGDGCMALPPEKRADPAAKCEVHAGVYALQGGAWVSSVNFARPPETPEGPALRKERAAIDAGRIEIREVRSRQLFVGDKPAGKPFIQP